MMSSRLQTRLAQLPEALLNRSPAFVLATVCAVLFIDILNISATLIALPSIQKEFHVSIGDLQWIITAYALTFGIFMVAGSRAGHKFTHRAVLLVGLAIFAVFSLVAALSPTFVGLAVARGFQGIGAALTVPSAQAQIGLFFHDPASRSKALWIEGTSASITSLIGLVLGGAFTQYLSWRWIFWLSLFINVHLIPAVVLLLPIRKSTAETGAALPDSKEAYASNTTGRILEIISSLDLGGLVLSLASALLFTYAVSSSNENGWSSGKVLGPFVIALFLLAGFGFYETRLERPMLPLDLLSSLSLDLTLFSAVLVYGVRQACIFFLTLQFQYNGSKPLDTAVQFLPMAVTGLLFTAVSGQLVVVIGTRALFSTGWILSIIGTVFFSFIAPDRSYWSSAFIGEILWSTGVGAIYISGSFAAVSACEPAKQGISATFFNVLLQVGGSVLGLVIVLAIGLSMGDRFGGQSVQMATPQLTFQAVYYTCAVLSFIGLLIGVVAVMRPGTEQAKSAWRSRLEEKLNNEKGVKHRIVHTTHDMEAAANGKDAEAIGDWRMSLVASGGLPGFVEAGNQTGRSLFASRANSFARSDYSSEAGDKMPAPPAPSRRSSVAANGVVRYASTVRAKQLHSATGRTPPMSRKNSFDMDSQSKMNAPHAISRGPSPLDSLYSDGSRDSFAGPTPLEGPNPQAVSYVDKLKRPNNFRSVSQKSAKSTISYAVSALSSRRPSLKRSVDRNNSFARPRPDRTSRSGPPPAIGVETTVIGGKDIVSPMTPKVKTPGSRSIALNNSYAAGEAAFDYAMTSPTTPAKTPRTARSLASELSQQPPRTRSRSRGRHVESRSSWYTDQEPLPVTAPTVRNVAERDENPAPQPVAGAHRPVPTSKPSVESVVERMRDQGWEHSARIAGALKAAASTERPLPPLPPTSPSSIYDNDENGAASRRTSWSSWHPTKTPKLDMSFSFEQLPTTQGERHQIRF